MSAARGADTDRGHVLITRSAGRSVRVAAAKLAGELRRHSIAVSEVGYADVDSFGLAMGDRTRRGPVLAVIAVAQVGRRALGLAVDLDAALCPLDVTDPLPDRVLDTTAPPSGGVSRPVAQVGCDGARSVTTGPVAVAGPGRSRLACSAFHGTVDSLEIIPAGPDRLRVLSAAGEASCSAIAVDSAVPIAVTFDDRALSCRHVATRAHHRLLRWAGPKHSR